MDVRKLSWMIAGACLCLGATAMASGRGHASAAKSSALDLDVETESGKVTNPPDGSSDSLSDYLEAGWKVTAVHPSTACGDGKGCSDHIGVALKGPAGWATCAVLDVYSDGRDGDLRAVVGSKSYHPSGTSLSDWKSDGYALVGKASPFSPTDNPDRKVIALCKSN